MSYYHRVFVGLGVLWLAGACLAAYGLLETVESASRLTTARKTVGFANEQAESLIHDAEREEGRLPPVRAFVLAWEPHVRANCDEREIGLVMRSGLEALAQQRLGLVTDQATTPEPVRLPVSGRTLRVQRVGLRASGENLGALVAWLGEAEAHFPYARVDSWELSSAGGVNSALRVTFAHPLREELSDKKGGQQK